MKIGVFFQPIQFTEFSNDDSWIVVSAITDMFVIYDLAAWNGFTISLFWLWE